MSSAESCALARLPRRPEDLHSQRSDNRATEAIKYEEEQVGMCKFYITTRLLSESHLYSEQHSRPGFPDVSSPGTRTVTRSVGENLTEWETGSPSSDGGTQGAMVSGVLLMSSSVKYIPINYFEYFDSAHLDSDEFSDSWLTPRLC